MANREGGAELTTALNVWLRRIGRVTHLIVLMLTFLFRPLLLQPPVLVDGDNKEGVWGGSSTFKEDSTGDIHKDTRERKHKSLNDLSIN